MAWNGGELSYIVRLLESRGNKDVPRSAIVSYLATQGVGADIDNKPEIASAIYKARTLWQKGSYDKAIRVVRDAWAKEQNL